MTLYEWIEKKGLRKQWVGEQLGIARVTMWRINKGEPVSYDTAIKVREYTDGEVKVVTR